MCVCVCNYVYPIFIFCASSLGDSSEAAGPRWCQAAYSTQSGSTSTPFGSSWWFSNDLPVVFATWERRKPAAPGSEKALKRLERLGGSSNWELQRSFFSWKIFQTYHIYSELHILIFHLYSNRIFIGNSSL